MKKRMDEISAGNAPKTTHEDASRCSGPGASDSLLPVKQAPKAHHLPEKFVPAAINGEYVDFSEVLASLSVLRPDHSDAGMLRTLSGDLIPIARPPRKRPVDSFDVWLQVWTKYEMEIFSARTELYLELAAFREQIQLANRKFCWPSTYLFDVQTRVHAASPRDAQARLDVLDTTLYTTILDASALRLHPKQCTRCKSFDHLVRDCSFLAQEKPQEAASSPSKPWANGTSAIDLWKLQKQFTTASQEGCNLYQQYWCNLGEACRRAHVCKACRGDHPQADCPPEIKSPFNLQTWRECLRTYSDADFVTDLLHDIEFGVRIGYQPATHAFQTYDNYLSSRTSPGSVTREIERELDLNLIVEPFLAPPFQHFTNSPLGAILKKHSALVNWRMIHDLSWPAGLPTDDGIPKDLFSCNYESLDRAITLLKHFDPGALMSNLDLSDTFRHVLVHEGD